MPKVVFKTKYKGNVFYHICEKISVFSKRTPTQRWFEANLRAFIIERDHKL